MTTYIVALALVCGIAAGTSHCDHAKSHKPGGQVAAPAAR
jgi:hypothetical protein